MSVLDERRQFQASALLNVRGLLLEAFDQAREPEVVAEMLTAVEQIDQAIDAIAGFVPDLAAEIDNRQPAVYFPDHLPEDFA